jgi:hypothetical protein
LPPHNTLLLTASFSLKVDFYGWRYVK